MVLSQRFPEDNKVHLLLPEMYVRNRELLAVKFELEERTYWLEGPEQKFLLWTDQKDLE